MTYTEIFLAAAQQYWPLWVACFFGGLILGLLFVIVVVFNSTGRPRR